MKKLFTMAALAALTLSYTSPSFPQSSPELEALGQKIEGLRGDLKTSEALRALSKEIEGLKDGQESLQKDLQEIKTLLQARPAAAPPAAPQNAVFNIDGAPFKGEQTAKLTLIEFSDFQCPFCGRHAHETWPQLEKDYISTGKLKYIFLNFPLESIHQNAFKAAEAADCAGEQGKFWEMHDRLFANQQAISPNDLPGHAEALGLDTAKFQQCLESGKFAAAIRQGMAEGQRAGVTGTPAFFLGLTDSKDGKVKALRTITGAQAYPAFQATIDSLLSEQK